MRGHNLEHSGLKKPVSYMGTIKAHFLKSQQLTEQEISCFMELCSLPLSE
jgi:hypothetical protein